MLIRKADETDMIDILSWRNDQHSKNMSFDSSNVSLDDHKIWYQRSLLSETREIFIGEDEGRKIGVCRFDLNLEQENAEVSINLNPSERNKGFSKQLLSLAVQEYILIHKLNIIARIKKENSASKKIFESVGFIRKISNKTDLIYIRPLINLRFEIVKLTQYHIEILYDFLNRRIHNISHKTMPSIEAHTKFMESNPYLHWHIAFYGEIPVGSFYIQPDNSIGLNLLEVRNEWVSEILNYVVKNFAPVQPIPSKIPPYFFINIPFNDERMSKVLSELEIQPIQISYKVALED